jgi:hypothetical protein
MFNAETFPVGNYPQSYQTPLPAYARVPRRKRARTFTLVGCGALLLILIFLAFTSYQWLNAQHQPTSTDKPTSTPPPTATSQTQHDTSTAPVVTTLNLKSVTYASVNISVIDVQQATGFPDDQPYQPTDMLRITLQENNTSSQTADYFYSDCAHLILPDGTIVASSQSKDGYGPAQDIKRTTWIDFLVSRQINPQTIMLQLGTSTESQIKIPLKKDANLDSYQPKTVPLHTPLHYGSTVWTLTSATQQLSYHTKQADKGMVYIIVGITIDNPGQQSFYPFPDDYVRLQSGATKNGPTYCTLPSYLNAQQTNSQGECGFLMPATSTAYTFLLLPNTDIGATQQVSSNFQLG